MQQQPASLLPPSTRRSPCPTPWLCVSEPVGLPNASLRRNLPGVGSSRLRACSRRSRCGLGRRISPGYQAIFSSMVFSGFLVWLWYSAYPCGRIRYPFYVFDLDVPLFINRGRWGNVQTFEHASRPVKQYSCLSYAIISSRVSCPLNTRAATHQPGSKLQHPPHVLFAGRNQNP
jgi:hypothetical protein